MAFSLCWLAPRRADGTARRDAEEYIGALGAYTPEQPLHAEAGGRGCDIFRVPLGPEGARFDAPRDRVWQASADNCGGLVVTVWGTV